MVTDHQVRLVMKLLSKGNPLYLSAAKSGMDEKTARKYRDLNQLPSEIKVSVREYKTRQSPLDGFWDIIYGMLDVNPGLQSQTILKHLISTYNGRDILQSDGREVLQTDESFETDGAGETPDKIQLSWNQLRTLQRGIKKWRATKGPGKEVYFSQIYHPGERCQSDFTHMDALGVTINGQPFSHLLYHFILPYSNWQTGSICFSESFESLSDGLQNALHKLGGVPKSHQTDQLTAAVHQLGNQAEFTDRYQSLLKHYSLSGRKIEVGKPNQNGDIEQSNYRIKEAVDQSLMIRGSRDFKSREEYEYFLRQIFDELNSACLPRFEEEAKVLQMLPKTRLAAMKKFRVRVSQSSTIAVNGNIYSVNSRLIREQVIVLQYAENLQVWYGQKQICELPRLVGRGKYQINYRHIIDSLVRKPGAFEDYCYKADLFPTSIFRMAYDLLQEQHATAKASREYLKILELAAKVSETKVNLILNHLLDEGLPIEAAAVKQMLLKKEQVSGCGQVKIDDVDLLSYDRLLNGCEVQHA